MNKECGNCGSMDTITYYDTETIKKAIEKVEEEVLNRYFEGSEEVLMNDFD